LNLPIGIGHASRGSPLIGLPFSTWIQIKYMVEQLYFNKTREWGES